MNIFHVKNTAFSKKDARERAICTKLGRSKNSDFLKVFEKMSDFHVKNTAFSRKDVRERVICTKLGHPILFMILNYCFHKI